MNEVVSARYYRASQSSEPFRPDAVAVSPLIAFSILWRRRYGILAIGTALSAMVLVWVSTMGQSYVSSASVLIQEHKSSLSDIQTGGTVGSDSVAVRTQADILRSADLARSVVVRLHLVDEPEFAPAVPGRLAVAVAAMIATVRAWDSHDVLGRLGLFGEAVPPTAEQRLAIATETLLGVTSIVNDGRSYVIEIKVKLWAEDAGRIEHTTRLSSSIANAYAETYTQFTGKVKSDTIRQAFGFFDERVAALQNKVERAEYAVQAYRNRNNLVENRGAAGDGRPVTMASQQLAQLNTDLSAAIADRVSKEASLDQVNAARAGRVDLQSVAEIVASPLIQRLRGQQADLGAKEAGLSASRGAANPDLVAIRAAQRDSAAQIATEAGKIGASLRGSVDAARAREAALRSKLAVLQTQVSGEGVSEITLRQLQSEADIARTVYSTYFKRSAETSEQLDMQEPNALVVSKASVPLAATPPSKKQLGGFGIVASFVIAGVIALARERASNGMRTGVELEIATGVETLGYVPRVKNLAEALAFKNPSVLFSEAILAIRTLLQLSGRGSGRVLMVTSALPGEGKTFLAAALARNAALAGERVLLMDCSIRRPAVADTIGPTGSRSMDGVTIRSDGLSPLDIITLGSDLRSPPDLFASSQMRNLIEMLRSRYDLIVLDTPPVLAGSDARVLSGLCDSVMLVAAWCKTPQAVLMQAANLLRGGGSTIAGVVMNFVDVGQLSRNETMAAYGQKRL